MSETDILSAILAREPVATVLERLCLILESKISDCMVAVLQLTADGHHLGACIGPHLPTEYRTAVEGLPIAENSASCGTAAYRRDAVYVTDTMTDPLWESCRPLVFKFNIRASWSQPILDPDGQLLGILCVSHTFAKAPQSTDSEWMLKFASLAGVCITFIEYEKKLQDLNNRLDWVMTNSMTGFWDTDLSTGNVTRSPGFMQILGFDDNGPGPQRRNWRERIHPDDMPRHDQLVNACARGESASFELEYRIRTNQGDWRWLLDRGQRTPQDPDTGHVHMRGMYSDITRLKKTEQSLAMSERRFRDFAHAAADIFWEQNAQLQFSWVSDNALNLMGIPGQQFYGKRRDEFVSATQLKTTHWQKHLAQLTARQPFTNFEYPLDGPGMSQKIVQASGMPLFDHQGQFAGYRGTARDVTEQRRHLDRVTHDASHDRLTGLLNASEFEKQLAQNVSDARRDNLQRVVCYLDLDRFKQVNDDAGHAAGDAMLTAIAAVLQNQVRSNDVLARLGGDEFGLLLRDCPEEKAQTICAQIILAANAYRLQWQGYVFSVGLSIGMVMLEPCLDPKEMLAQADSACYSAKEQGRNSVFLYQSAHDS